MSAAGILVAAPSSGAGKTTLTLGLLAALRRRGVAVGSFKVGPDYIDPAFHSVATERPTFNIDPWAMRFETLAGLLEASGQGCDLLVGEGVMGLFDGAADGTGATADIAALFGLPVPSAAPSNRPMTPSPTRRSQPWPLASKRPARV